ncbi:M20 metallopeptidase family protein [Pontimonas salivibrio]|nr:M20 family metallopeptidase [Pontimonas salivibrio]
MGAVNSEKQNAKENDPASASALFPSMVRHRRHLHQHPEVGLELPDTHAYIVESLKSLGYETEHHPRGGVSVTVGGSDPSATPMVFRADMDALPVEEPQGMSFRSVRSGAMHACGHDLHMATLLGVAEHFATHTPPRPLVFAFQPGEESDRGALNTLKHRNLNLEDATTFAVHVNAVLPSGSVHYSRDTFMAFGDWFDIALEGPGGHASAPERAGNPILAGSDITRAFVGLANELSEARARVVATVTEFLSGNTVNVIPTTAGLRGTIRTVTEAQRAELHRAMREKVIEIAEAQGLQATLTIHDGYPAVISDAAFIDRALNTFAAAGITDVHEMEHPSMVIEDFSYFLHRWPGAMVYVGAAVGESPAFNHSAEVLFDEDAMATALKLFIALTETP